MASDYRVRFSGDLGNLAQFSQSIKGAFSQIRSAYQNSGSAPIKNIASPNLNTSKVTTQIDAYNRTLVQSGQVFHRYVSGYVADISRLQSAERKLGNGGTAFGANNTSLGTSRSATTGKVGVFAKDFKPKYDEFFTGDYKQTVADLDKVERAQSRLLPAQKEFLKLQKDATVGAARYSAQRETAEGRINELSKAGNALLEKRRLLTTGALGNIYTSPSGRQSVRLLPQLSELNKIRDYYTAQGHNPDRIVPDIAQNNLTPVTKLQHALRDIRGIGTLDSDIATITAEQKKVERLLNRIDKNGEAFIQRLSAREKALLKKYAPQIRSFQDSLKTTPPIARDLDFFLGKSKDFRKEFIKQMGLSTPYVPAPKERLSPTATLAEEQAYNKRHGPVLAQRERLSQELIAKGIDPSSISVVRDLEKGVYRVSGAVRDANGYTGTWTKTLDNNFRGVERLGGSLRGTGGFLRQTSRDFQKVIEWTVATTLVFGTLGAAIGSVSTINQVNKDLQRFSLTAQTSSDETKRAFSDIADIAYRTATPLQELTAVMDDIALATRRSSQTSSEWKQAINSLAESVGILTNLTGVDTVRATDLLSAAYKQLQIAPNQLIPVLNKVTAVAGGNAQAIEDIVAALGSVSEAAKAAGLTLDQQIAAVQTLSQVTNKSATEVATSFKNLFGAISSPGSVKALDKFGIAVRNARGELRPFLDIYKDIYDARQAGKISEGQLQDVLRGISGGPRRAPDAAALLSNIPLIYEQLGKSVGATNEALLANAKVLDTNAAKLQQLRTKFDTALVESFTEAVNKLVRTIVNLGGAFSGVFGAGSISGVGSAATQLGLMLLAVFALTKGFGLLGKGIRGIRSDFSGLVKAEKSAYLSLAKWTGPATRVVTPSRLAPTGPLPPLRTPYTSGAGGLYSGPASIARPRTTPYLPVFRPGPPPRVPGAPNPLGNREYRRSAQGRADAEAARRGQVPLPGASPFGMNPAYGPRPVKFDPSYGLVPLRQQAKEEIAFRKAQINNAAEFIKTRGAQEAGYIKARILQEADYRRYQITSTLSANATIFKNEVAYRRAQLESHAGYFKARIAEEAKYRKEQVLHGLLGTTKGRIGLGVAGGLATGAALGAAGLATGNLSTFASAGQGIGLTLAMLGGPLGIAAGVSLAAVSTGLSAWADQQERVKEKQKELRFSVVEGIKALTEQRKSLMDAENAQKESRDTIDELTGKKKLDADETNRLATATDNYIDATFKLSDANRQVSETTEDLLLKIGGLGEKYADLINLIKNQGADPKVLKDLSAALTGDILGINGQALNPDIFTKRPSANSTAVVGNVDPNDPRPALQASGFYDKLLQADTATVIKYLNGQQGKNLNGFEINKQVIDLIGAKLAAASDEEKANTVEFGNAVKTFGDWALLISAPRSLTQSKAGSLQAQIQAQSALGILSGEQANNASGRSAAVQKLLDRLGTLDKLNAGSAQRPLAENAAGSKGGALSFQSIDSLLFGNKGQGGFLGGANGPNTLKVTAAEASKVFEVITKLDGSFAGLSDNQQIWNAAVFKYFSDIGIVLEEFKGDAEAVGNIYDDLKTKISEDVVSGQKGLYDQLLQLRSQKQGGEFSGKPGNKEGDATNADYTEQRDQLYALIKAYSDLGGAFQANAGHLDEFRDRLSKLHGFQGIQLEDTENLLPALFKYIDALGLTGDQVKALTKELKALLGATSALDGIRASFHVSATLPTAQLRAFLVALRATLMASVSSGELRGGAERAASARLREIDAALKTIGAAEHSAGAIQDIVNHGSGTAGPGGSYSPKSSGGGGGGGKSKPSPPKPALLDIPDEFHESDRTVASLLKEAVRSAKSLQSKIPGANKENKNQIVAILDGTKKVLQTRGIGEEFLRRAMEELAAQIKKQNDLLAKADTIRRIRVGNGDFSAIANVPVNSKSGISLGGANGPINITLNLNGTVLTPAQFDQFANQIAAALKRQIAN